MITAHGLKTLAKAIAWRAVAAGAFAASLLMSLGSPAPATAADISMSRSDTFGQSSFTTGTSWTGNAAPVAGNNYFTGSFTLRTPNDSSSNFTFAGDALTIDAGGAFNYKGLANTKPVITVNNLIMDGGLIGNVGNLIASGTSTLTLSGTMKVASNSGINMGVGDSMSHNFVLNSTVTGTGGFYIGTSTVSGSVNPAMAVTINGNNSNFSGGFFISRNYTNKNNNTVTLNGTNATYPQLMSSATITLGHVNALGTGQLGIDAGTVNLNGYSPSIGSLSGTGGFVVNNGGGAVTFTVGNDNKNSTYSGSIQDRTSGAGTLGLTKLGSGTLTLSGSNSHTGGTIINAGRLTLGHVNGLGGGAVTVGGGELNIGSYAPSVTGFTITSGSLVGSGTLTSGSAFDVRSGSIAAILGGAAGLTKSTSGTVTLSGANTYQGATAVEAGTLRMAAVNAIASSSGVTLGSAASEGTFDLNGHDQDVKALTFANLGGSVQNSSASGELFMKNLATGTATITVQSATSNSIAPTLQLASNTVINVGPGAALGLLGSVMGAGSLTKSGSGTLTLHGNNSYSGGTYITGGSVVVTGGATPFGAGAITLSDFTTLDLGGMSIGNAITFASNSATVTILNSGTLLDLISSGNVSSGTAATITTGYRVKNGAVVDFQGPLAGQVQVDSGKGLFTAINGPGVVTVATDGQAVFSGTIAGSVMTSGSTLFSGPILHQVTVNGGTATFTGATLAGVSGTSSVDVNGGRAIFSGTVGGSAHVGSGGAAGFSNRITGGLTVDAGGTATLGDGATYESADLENAGTLVVNRTTGNDLTLATKLGGTGSFLKQGGGTLTLTNANDFTGPLTVSSGTLQIGNGGGGGSLVGNVVNNAALVFNRSGTSTYVGDISGNGILRKLGAGTVKLSGSHSHSGGTTVSEGTLSINGYLGGSSALVVESGATIGGSGVIAGGITGDGQIGPGNSPGILTTPSITPTGSTSFAFEFTQLGAPTWSTGTASGNDVLRLIDLTMPFKSSLATSNLVNVYFNVDTLSINNTFLGGFFTDKSGDFSAFVKDATFHFYVLGNGSGTAATYNGAGYYDLTSWAAANLSGFTKVGMSTVASGTTDFASGTITTGQVTQFVIIPEPDTIIFAGIGIAMAGWSLWKRRRLAQILRNRHICLKRSQPSG